MKTIRWDKNTLVSMCDEPDQQVMVNGKVWRFDYDRRLGPLWLRKDGSDRRCQNPNKAVWAAFEEWIKTRDKDTELNTAAVRV
jgi:hypothetical protein